jgi:aminoglycoside phosphotransferase (APT) family kinase protein
LARWCRCTRFLDGDLASKARIGDLTGFATTLARFLNALGRVDATGGPEPGQHNFFRGGPLATYEHETLKAIDALVDEVPQRRRQASLGRRHGHLVGP